MKGCVTYRGASEYELGSMGSNSSSFRVATVEGDGEQGLQLRHKEPLTT